jgi:DNA polymerase I-like protein with 3'-5' exonuclease and polymerase domains
LNIKTPDRWPARGSSRTNYDILPANPPSRLDNHNATAADAIKHALILLHRRLPEGAAIVATIHDEIVVECQDEDAGEVLGLTKTAMLDGIGKVANDCPVEVEGGVGKTWGSAK